MVLEVILQVVLEVQVAGDEKVIYVAFNPLRRKRQLFKLFCSRSNLVEHF